MKKLFYLFMFVMAATFCGCSQDSEPVYSCNEAINEWTKENLEAIQQMTRSDWNQLAESQKGSAYGAFTQDQKICFWLEKLEEVKSLGWSDNELRHLDLIKKFINNHKALFGCKKLTDDQSDELHYFCYSWIQKGIEDFGWSEKTAISIIGIGNVVLDKEGTILMSTGSDHLIDGDGKVFCHCHAGNILFTSCTSGRTLCESSDCKTPDFNHCGFFLAEECNGICM